MSGINDKSEEWYQWAKEIGSVTPSTCADQLMELARTAWHPVSEPPTEADGDRGGRVIVRLNTEHEYNIEIIYYADVSPSMRRWEWARIRDVVLMPPQGGE